MTQMFKIYFFVFISLIACITKVYSQVTIGSEYEPNLGSLLDLKEYDDQVARDGGRNAMKGLLIPRVNLSSVISLVDIHDADQNENVAYTGLTVYNPTAINETCLQIPEGLYSWDGEEWINASGGKTFDSNAKKAYYGDVKILLTIYKSNPDVFPGWGFNEDDPDKPLYVGNTSEVIFEKDGCGNDRLTKLTIVDKGLTSLNVSDATALVDLNCSRNEIPSLTLPSTDTFRTLECSNNKMTNLNITGASKIRNVICGDNNLSSLDLSNTKEIFYLNCERNKISTLALDGLSILSTLFCGYNLIENLDLTNNSQLGALACDYNDMESIDVTKNPLLHTLYAGGNSKMDDIDVSANLILEKLSCDYNNLTALDVSANKSLIELYCNNNKIKVLSLEENTELLRLKCYDNQINKLDLSANRYLTELYCNNNLLTELDVVKNTELTNLDCGSNLDLSVLDFTKNKKLKELTCSTTKTKQLDLTQNADLIKVDCGTIGSSFSAGGVQICASKIDAITLIPSKENAIYSKVTCL